MKPVLPAVASFVVFAVGSLSAAAQDTYVIVEGPGAVTTLLVARGSKTVDPAVNSSTQASGTIGVVPTGKHAGALAFHGTLNGEPDPDPGGIGWGIVKAPEEDSLLDRVASVASGLAGAQRALDDLDQECDSFKTAELKIALAKGVLLTAKSEIPALVESGALTAKDAKAIGDAIQDLADLLGDLKDEIASVAADKTTTFDELVKKLIPIQKKLKKSKKLLKDLLKQLKKADQA